jgi:hypothetical protein
LITYLKDRKNYEDRYDKSTVEKCRSGERIVNSTFRELEKKLPRKELLNKLPGWYLQYSQYYFLFVEAVGASRAEHREATIDKWMKEDSEQDDRLSSAQLNSATYCLSCGKDTKIISKDYMHREGHKDDGILFMLECTHCKKRQAYWQDGTPWEGAKHECEKCGGTTVSKHTKKDKIITWTEICSKCNHIKTETMDLSDTNERSEELDRDLELDLKRFVFDSNAMFKFSQKLAHFERMAKLHESTEDKIRHPDVYDGIKQVKLLKIAQLKELLEPLFLKNGYSDFKLGEPRIVREVSIEFSCLDTVDDREEYESKKMLHKAIDQAQEDTNWRVMSAGLSYRLGYVTGNLRAYESEEDIKNLVEQRMKKGYVPKIENTVGDKIEQKPKDEFYNRDMRESVLVYFDKLMLDNIPAEVTLKSGVVKQTGIPVLMGEMNPLLRVFIPMRESDESVPNFIRDYDFKFRSHKDLSKIKKDSRGRPIRIKNPQSSKG